MPARNVIWHTFWLPVAIALVGLALNSPGALRGASCGVPDDYETIQQAVDDSTCDKVILRNITFNENVTINRQVLIDGSDGTVIKGTGSGSVLAIGTLTQTAHAGLRNLTITHGGQTAYGGGIANYASVTLIGVTVSGNSAGLGGGIYNGGSMSIYNSTVNGNSATQFGGGLLNDGSLDLYESTVSGNAADYGGAIFNNNFAYSQLSLFESTLAFNLANAAGRDSNAGGGGVYNVNRGVVYLENTILDSNAVLGCSLVACIPLPNDCAGSLYSYGFNLIGTLAGNCTLSGETSNNLYNLSARLGPLANNGGPTATHALLPGSPAIDAIWNGQNGCGINPPTDQRGWARPYPRGKNCDIGAYERGAFTFLPLIAR